MDNGQDIIVEEGETLTDPGHAATLTMPRERAELLFHDLNRLLSITDPAWLSPGDRAAYNRLDRLTGALQRELQIEPE